jgi:ADP-dependent NAD(P)H-hydrate dehydratase
LSYVETSDSLIHTFLPKRKDDSRKGENGRVLVVGGSRVYHGAPYHAARGAQSAGVDLVYVAVPATVSLPIRSMSADLIVYPLPDQKLTKGCARRLIKWIPGVDSAVIGPGMEGVDPEALQYLVTELQSMGAKLVLDAGAIIPGFKLTSFEGVAFTPHAGEFKRLTGVELPRQLEERVPLVAREASKLGCVILQKGHGDVITNGSATYVSRTGCSAMTVGGTGDVLAGVVAGFCALGVQVLKASVLASHANGVAGTLARSRYGNRITASDLYDLLRGYFASFENVGSGNK